LDLVEQQQQQTHKQMKNQVNRLNSCGTSVVEAEEPQRQCLWTVTRLKGSGLAGVGRTLPARVPLVQAQALVVALCTYLALLWALLGMLRAEFVPMTPLRLQ
jgi:hypothetical protein